MTWPKKIIKSWNYFDNLDYLVGPLVWGTVRQPTKKDVLHLGQVADAL